ncbi:MAG: AAA family ATPase [Ilumatobacteraceae bacterium]
MTPIVCPSIVGRDDEWTLLVQCLDDAATRRGGLVALMGEVGIGKTRLVGDLAAVARERGMSVLVGRAVDSGTAVPFRALFEALSGYFRRVGADAHPELDGLRSTLAQLVPEWRAPGEEPYRASPMELGEAMVRLLAGIAGEPGCVLILEDLHWGDPDTAAVVEYIGDNLATVPVVCVLTLRPDVGAPVVRVVGELAARRSARVIELQRLSVNEMTVMTQLCLGTAVLPSEIDVLVRDFSDGLPFLVEELVASAVDAGSIVLGPEGWQVRIGGTPSVPPRFVELVRRRLAALPDDAARVLCAAAVLGPRFDADLLPVVTGLSSHTTTDALRRGVVHQLVIADPADARFFGFRHALTRDALLGQLLPFELIDVSRRALAALERYHPDFPGVLCELAASLAEMIDDRQRTAELLLLAAGRAYATGALSSAEPMLDRAWARTDPDQPIWHEIGRLLVQVLRTSGDVDRALEVGTRLLAASATPSDRVRAHLEMARAATTAGRWDTAAAHVEWARRISPRMHGAPSALIDLTAAEIAVGRGRFGDARTQAQSASVQAELDGDQKLVAEAWLVIGRCARMDDESDPADAFDRVIAIGRDNGLTTLALRGEMERASLDCWKLLPNDRMLAARHRAASAGALVDAAHLDNFLAWHAKDRWQPDDVDVAAERCAELARKLHLDVLHGMALSAGAAAAGQRGDRDRMERQIAAALEASHGHADVAAACSTARVCLSLVRDDLGRVSSALDLAMDRLGDAPAIGGPDRGLWTLLRVIENRGAETMIADLEASPVFSHVANKAYRSYALAVLSGRSGDPIAASEHMAEGDGAVTPLAWFQHHARRLVAESALADGWGDPVSWLRDAVVYFERHGQAQLAASCRAILTRAGAPTPRRARESGFDVPADLLARGISAREVEVLERLAAAQATKDIATQLYLSPKTVERHIANLTVKLGVDGRAALVAFAAARAAKLAG